MFLLDFTEGDKRLTIKKIVEHGVFGGNVARNGSDGFVNKGWIFDGKQWTETEPMSVVRDQPACSLVEMDNGEVNEKALFL